MRVRQPEFRPIDNSRTEIERSQSTAERWVGVSHRDPTHEFQRILSHRRRRGVRERERRPREERQGLVPFGDCYRLMEYSLDHCINEFNETLMSVFESDEEEEEEDDDEDDKKSKKAKGPSPM